jgi:glucose-1-phosphate thymidylyltransferase
MKAIILAAGYGTRLAPLTDHCPKALLRVGRRVILDYILESLEKTDEIREVWLVSNAKFYSSFLEWVKEDTQARQRRFPIGVLNDGTVSDATRRGAIGDLWFALEQTGCSEEILVVAGDNLFCSSLSEMTRLGRGRQAPVVAVYRVSDLALVRQFNHLKTDPEGRILFFEEKPAAPADTLVAVGIYYFPKELLKWLEAYLAETENRDQPGRFIQWLVPRVSVYAWRLPGIWFDIGSRQALAEAEEILAQDQA